MKAKREGEGEIRRNGREGDYKKKEREPRGRWKVGVHFGLGHTFFNLVLR